LLKGLPMLEAPLPAVTLPVRPLTAAAFAPFGEVIEAAADVAHHAINAGYAQRFHDLARVDTAAAGGRTLVNIFRARPRTLPLRLGGLERHRLGSQLFMPLAPLRYLVVVAAPGDTPSSSTVHAFLAAPGQGINMRPGTWHHPLLALDDGGDFLVIDRGAADGAEDCEVHRWVDVEPWVDRLD